MAQIELRERKGKKSEQGRKNMIKALAIFSNNWSSIKFFYILSKEEILGLFFYSNPLLSFLKCGFLFKINSTIAYRPPHTHCLSDLTSVLFPALSTPTTPSVKSTTLYCFPCLAHISLGPYPLLHPFEVFAQLPLSQWNFPQPHIYNSKTPCTPTLSMLFLHGTDMFHLLLSLSHTVQISSTKVEPLSNSLVLWTVPEQSMVPSSSIKLVESMN